jgi:hypothetical protein
VAWTILCELPELGRLNRHQIAALVGVAPYARESGDWVGPRRIQGGRRPVRNAICMATVNAIRLNPEMRAYRDRLKGQGKPGRVTLVACKRELVVTLNAIARAGKPRDAAYCAVSTANPAASSSHEGGDNARRPSRERGPQPRTRRGRSSNAQRLDRLGRHPFTFNVTGGALLKARGRRVDVADTTHHPRAPRSWVSSDATARRIAAVAAVSVHRSVRRRILERPDAQAGAEPIAWRRGSLSGFVGCDPRGTGTNARGVHDRGDRSSGERFAFRTPAVVLGAACEEDARAAVSCPAGIRSGERDPAGPHDHAVL